MVTMMLILAGASLVVEMLIAYKHKIYRHFVQSSTMNNLIGSFGISYVLGWLFGAAGLTVLCAAVLSTAASIPIYAVSRVEIYKMNQEVPEDCADIEVVFA
jgi:hypothetical protein